MFLCLISVAIIAETEKIKKVLGKHGIDVETVTEIMPIRVQPARVLSQIYARLGERLRFLLCLFMKIKLHIQ